MSHAIRNQKGIALIIALMLVLMLTIVGLGIVTSSGDEVSIAGNELNEMRAFYAAEAGLDRATAAIQTHYENTLVPPTNFPGDTLELNGVTVGYGIGPDSAMNKTIPKGTLTGLIAFTRPYTIQSTAYDSAHSTAFTLEQSFEVAFVPLFQFSVFYENDLEIAPGPTMLLLGRIHCNSDMYLQSDNGLQVESYMTAHGTVLHGRKPGAGMSVGTGDVQIKALDGTFRSMKQGSDWLDAADAYWYDSASARWGGHVQDAAFAQDRLNIPLQSPTDSAHKIVERYAGGSNPDSYEEKATFKIIDGAAYYKSGSIWTDVTATLAASGAMVERTFFDKRENKNVTVYDLNMGVFKTSAYVPPNGIIYVSDQRAGLHGTRIYNATDIGAALTIASENPVYTKGDINTTTKKPMSIICDALTVLSGNWDDANAKASSPTTSDRPALATAVNFCYITGNTETGVGGAGYNGGLENLIRFLEDWTGQTMTFRGSMINLWYSQEATGNWSTSYYVPPTRNWAFDTDLNNPANMPPGTPVVRSFIRWGWKQRDVGYVATEFGLE